MWMGFPNGHRKTTTLVAGLRITGMVAPMVLDAPINGDWFEGYVAQVLEPELRWSRLFGQFGGEVKLIPGFDYAAGWSVVDVGACPDIGRISFAL
jgi:hypothetical protein